MILVSAVFEGGWDSYLNYSAHDTKRVLDSISSGRSKALRRSLKTASRISSLSTATTDRERRRMGIEIRIEAHGAIIRQRCPACHGETWKNNVQAFAYQDGRLIGALCEDCLKERYTGDLTIRGTVPTYAELEQCRRIEEADEGFVH
jgi:NAD-dependent SIR2 family protein deacetylase